MNKHIEVSFGPTKDIGAFSFSEPNFMGDLWFDYIRNSEIASFEYADSWLRAGNDIFIDPDIMLFSGRQYAPSATSIFGSFGDSCPDRWGRMLLQRNESRTAVMEKRPPRNLNEADYLLGVNDRARMGAFRFLLEGDDEFSAHADTNATPPWASLRALEQAAASLEDEGSTVQEVDEDLSLLLEPGSSLGGARPKASVIDTEGDLWIAKFPSKNDVLDTGLAEYLIHDLATDFEIDAPEAKVDRFGTREHTFLTKRFDREGIFRVHFSSAMNLLGKKDEDNSSAGVSYLDLAEFIREHGSHAGSDLRELFKRILFSIAVSNTDDHLRNHGFLLSEQGWRLSPAFDINPTPGKRGLSLNISEFDNALSFDLALSQAHYFDVSEKEAQNLIAEVILVSSTWESRAKKLGMSRSNIESLRPAFAACF